MNARLESRIPTSSKGSSAELLKEGSLFLGYFCGQTGMAFLMKSVLSKVQLAKDLFGVPAGFFVAATQQIVSFCIILMIMLGSRVIGKPLKIKKLEKKEFGLLLILSFAFTLNIGFNLLALSLLPLYLNLVIRACSPITTSIMQSLFLKERQSISLPEWACLFAGVICAAVVTLAESGGGIGGISGTTTFAFGVLCSVLSLIMAGLDFVMKAKLGSLKLKAIETNFYNAIPVAVIAFTIGSILPTPVTASWTRRFGANLTDLAVFKHLFQVNPSVFTWVAASGIAAMVYNLYVTFLVVKLSPATSSFAGNFNKSMSIVLSLFLLEANRPHDVRGYIKVGAVFGNIAAFTAYNMLKKRRQGK